MRGVILLSAFITSVFLFEVKAVLSPSSFEPASQTDETRTLPRENQNNDEKKETEPQAADKLKGKEVGDSETQKAVQQIIDEIYEKYGIRVHFFSGEFGGPSGSSATFGTEVDTATQLNTLMQLQDDLGFFNPEKFKENVQLSDIYITGGHQFFFISDTGKPQLYLPADGSGGVDVSNREQPARWITLGVRPVEQADGSYTYYDTTTLDHEIGHVVLQNNFSKFSQEEFANFKQSTYSNGYDISGGQIVSDPQISSQFASDMTRAKGYSNSWGQSSIDEDFATGSEKLRVMNSSASSNDSSNAAKSENFIYNFYSENLGLINKNYQLPSRYTSKESLSATSTPGILFRK